MDENTNTPADQTADVNADATPVEGADAVAVADDTEAAADEEVVAEEAPAPEVESQNSN